MNNRHTSTPPRNVNKLLTIVTIILLLLCILLSATIGVLYVKKATPQRLLSKLGFKFRQKPTGLLKAGIALLSSSIMILTSSSSAIA